MFSEKYHKQQHRESHTAPLRHDRCVGNAHNAHIETKDKPQTEQHMQHIDSNRSNHRNYSILHTRKPAVQTEEHNPGRHSPDAGIEVVRHYLIAVHNSERQLRERVLQQQHQNTQHSRYSHGTHKHCRSCRKVLSTKGLRSNAAGTHTDKRAVPIDKVEYRDTDSECADSGSAVATSSCNGCREDTHQRNGDVRDDIWYGYSKNLSVHSAKVAKIWKRTTKFIIL